jgi:plastocyanin
MAIYEVTLVHKEKITVPADSAADAVDRATKDVENRKVVFTPAQWSVKEKEETE